MGRKEDEKSRNRADSTEEVSERSDPGVQEHQLRTLALLNDIVPSMSLETTPSGLLRRLLEGASYFTKAEFGVACCRLPDGEICFAEVGLHFREDEIHRIEDALPTLFQPPAHSSSKMKIYLDPQEIASISPPLPPSGAVRGLCLYTGETQVGSLVLGHSRSDFDFMKGESVLTQLVAQASLMMVKFNLFREIEKKSRALEEVNAHLGRILKESEAKNRQLEEANKAINESKKELESFVYTASHDLKAPAVSIHGMATILMEDYGDKLDDQGKHYLNRLMSNAGFMEQLIVDLLEFSRVGRREQQAVDLPGDKVIQEVLDQCYDLARRRNVQMQIHSPLPTVNFDPTRLTQIFLNLITNAIKFMGDQKEPRVEIGGSRQEGFVEFYVKDNGIGIDPQYQNLVFGVFQRLKEVDVEGTGIGLAIVKKILDLAGGKIWFESKKGEGTTFFFRIPQKKDQRTASDRG